MGKDACHVMWCEINSTAEMHSPVAAGRFWARCVDAVPRSCRSKRSRSHCGGVEINVAVAMVVLRPREWVRVVRVKRGACGERKVQWWMERARWGRWQAYGQAV